jgi:hypothetical protein
MKTRICKECGCTETDACVVEDIDGSQRGCSWTLEVSGKVRNICDGCRPTFGELKIHGPRRDHRRREARR